jgi:cytochrome c556
MGGILQTWRWKFSLVAATVMAMAVALMVSVRAEGDVAAIVAKRQTTMKALSANVKAINDYTADKADQSAAIAAAKEIVELGKTVPSLFPPGTGMQAMPGKSGARPEIWTEQAKFNDAASALDVMSEALMSVVQSGSPPATRAALQALGKNGCGACHDSFRVKI